MRRKSSKMSLPHLEYILLLSYAQVQIWQGLFVSNTLIFGLIFKEVLFGTMDDKQDLSILCIKAFQSQAFV